MQLSHLDINLHLLLKNKDGCYTKHDISIALLKGEMAKKIVWFIQGAKDRVEGGTVLAQSKLKTLGWPIDSYFAQHGLKWSKSGLPCMWKHKRSKPAFLLMILFVVIMRRLYIIFKKIYEEINEWHGIVTSFFGHENLSRMEWLFVQRSMPKTFWRMTRMIVTRYSDGGKIINWRKRLMAKFFWCYFMSESGWDYLLYLFSTRLDIMFGSNM